MPCEHCNRTFREEALLRHQRVCTADKPMKPIRKASAATPAAVAEHSADVPRSSAAMYEQAAASAVSTGDAVGVCGGGEGDAPELQKCDGCGRSFAPAALTRHAKVCATVFQQKRKPMDMASQRLAGAARPLAWIARQLA